MYDLSTFKKQANAVIEEATSFFTKKGYTVSLSSSATREYDLIVDNGTELKKVRVTLATSQTKYGIYMVRIKVASRKDADHKNYDTLYIMTNDNTRYLIPTKEILCKYYFSLNRDMDKFIVE